MSVVLGEANDVVGVATTARFALSFVSAARVDHAANSAVTAHRGNTRRLRFITKLTIRINIF